MGDAVDDLNRQAAARPEGFAFRDAHGTITYEGLAQRVAGLAADLEDRPKTIGILAPNGIDWVVADLACKLAAKTTVPLPPFFSPEQLIHIVRDADIQHVLCIGESMAAAAAPDAPRTDIGASGEADPGVLATRNKADRWRRIIYTSGTTGQPKGVILASAQIESSVDALIAAVGAGSDDRYLSVLPFALLLEQICGIYVPLRVGASSYLADGVAAACRRGLTEALVDLVDAVRPSVMVLVPGMLAGWVAALRRTAQRAPDSLRFVAVGGAHIAPRLAAAAWRCGIPAHEGYGLTECCSVVALNRPGERRAGTAGKPLPGLDVEIDDGEIVVTGPNVMAGYVNDVAHRGCWRTGDLGALDDEGYMTVYGRLDNVIVTSFGRNISPEWIEAMILAEPRIERCFLIGDARPSATAVIVASETGGAWFAKAGHAEVLALIGRLCAAAPEYARPQEFILTDDAELGRHGLLRRDGRPERVAIARHFASPPEAGYARGRLMGGR